MEDELDAILPEYSNFYYQLQPGNFCSSSNFNPVPGSSTFVQTREPSHPETAQQTASTSFSSSFATLKSDAKVEQAKANAVPSNTRTNTNLISEHLERVGSTQASECSSFTEWPVHLFIAQPQELDHWLSKLVLETPKANEEPYLPDTLYGICSDLLRFIREIRPEINIS